MPPLSSWPGEGKCHGVGAEDCRRSVGGMGNTTGVLTNRAPPLSGRWKRSLCHGVGAEDRAVQVARHQPLHLGPRAALPPAVLWFHWRSWAFKTYGRTARLVVLSTKFPFPPAGGASIAPSPSGCPFILGALSSWFHWRFLVPFQNRVREVRDLDPPTHPLWVGDPYTWRFTQTSFHFCEKAF